MLNTFTFIGILLILAAIAIYIYRAHADACDHDWVKGSGWITIGPGTQTYYDGERCTKCHVCRDAPHIEEYHEHRE